MVASGGQIDTTVEIVTPENIAFSYQVAGPFRRFGAYAIDVLLRVMTFMLLAFAATIALAAVGLGDVGMAVVLVSWFLLSWFYGGLFETFWNGQTPGKRAMKIRVLSADGQPINGLQAVLRNVLRAVDNQPFFLAVGLYQVGLLAAASNDRFQRLGDMAAGTMVVVEQGRRLRGVIRVEELAAVRLAGELPAAFRPSPSLARALASYVERRRYFSPARRAEIARHVGEVLRDRFGLPAETDLDLLLCALYHRAFVNARNDERPAVAATVVAATVVAPSIAAGSGP